MLDLLERIQKSNQVLGLNHRNAAYIRPYNKSRAKRIADDKLLCKTILSRHGIPTAEIYKVIRNYKQLSTLDWNKLPNSFALKPNIGTGGSGIIIFYGKKKNALEWIKPDGSTMSVEQIKNHIGNILEGQFSMGNRRDIAIIEERIVNDPLLKQYSYKGVPDIRVIVFNKVPIMAELRLPTYESEGKANLHAGGIGVGIDIATGITTTAIHRRGFTIFDDLYDIVETTLDEKKLTLRGIQIPRWKEILKIAIKCQEVVKLGYLGADIALDRYKGPMVFELNARSGLAIQIANLSGMKERIERVKGLKIKDADHGIRVAQNLFGGEVEDEVKAISGRQIIGLIEKATLYPIQQTTDNSSSDQTPSKHHKKQAKQIPEIKTKAQVNTGFLKTRISDVMAARLGYKPALDCFASLEVPESFEKWDDAENWVTANKEKISSCENIAGTIVLTEENKIRVKPLLPIRYEIADQIIESKAIVALKNDLIYHIILGREDLRNFLIDTSKTFVLH